MLRISPGCDEHEKFKKLCALAACGSLAPLELVELQAHLEYCEQCHEVFGQYRYLSTQGLTVLADSYVERPDQPSWDVRPVRERLLLRVRADQQTAREYKNYAPVSKLPAIELRSTLSSLAKLAVAAVLLFAVAVAAYRLGVRTQTQTVAQSIAPPPDSRFRELSHEKRQAEELFATQAKRLAQLQAEGFQKEQELAKLRTALRALEDRSSKLIAANSQSDAQLLALTQQRDALTAQLEAVSQAYGSDKAELAKLHSDQDKTLLHASSLEAKIAELTATNRDQASHLKDTEQFLTSDRDIRELMGARRLYIADVYDVDGSSRTQKPFGRVFYTQGRSLIFYAFDLDHEPGVVNASTFQVWGQREAPQGQQAMPMNLGILYMDNETNRRWVMRFDDPKKLAEIDAVFVTVEPRGGSHKPTSKPFLYALLRNEANHP
jgi:hypothetical protein